MKKARTVLAAILIAVSLSACGESTGTSKLPAESHENSAEKSTSSQTTGISEHSATTSESPTTADTAATTVAAKITTLTASKAQTTTAKTTTTRAKATTTTTKVKVTTTGAAKTTVSTNPASAGIAVTSFPSVVHRNEEVSLTIHGKPNTTYTLWVNYNSGPSKAAGLGPKTSDANGVVTWTWKIGGKTASGKHSLGIEGDGEQLVWQFEVAE